MNILEQFSKNYEQYGLYFYIEATQRDKVFCNYNGNLLFTIIIPPMMQTDFH
jgi:hypothetical protein